MRAPLLAPLLLALLASATPGCRTMPTTVKVVLTPLTVVRDVIDVPLVSITNVFHVWALASSPIPQPSAGVAVGTGGVGPYVGVGLGYYIWTPLAWIFGAVDWVICRSFWPGWPWGTSPFKEREATWGSLYWPNTIALWSDDEGDDAEEAPTKEPGTEAPADAG